MTLSGEESGATPEEGARAARDDDLADVLSRVIDDAIEDGISLPALRRRIVREMERCYVARMLARHGGSAARSAACAGLAERYFRKLKARHVKSR
jgi:hypothetical protein